MNIFYYFRELNTPMYKWQRIHIFDELERFGHRIITFNPLDYASINEANEVVVKNIKLVSGVDFFLTCVDSRYIYPSTIVSIKKMGIPTVLICWDNLELPFKHKNIAPLFDLVWLTSIETKYLFEKWGCKNIIFQTYAANPFVFVPNWESNIFKLGFIGSPYGSRINVLNELLTNGIECSVYSNSLFDKGYNSSLGAIQQYKVWNILTKTVDYLKFPIGRKVLYSTIKNKLSSKTSLLNDSSYLYKYKSVSDKEMTWLYSNLALSLNITALRDTYILKNPISKMHLRTFEIPMSGGLEFVSYSDEIVEYFEEDKEIVLYRSKEEMIDKARFYLNEKNAHTVMKIKRLARKRAENEHTWERRFSVIFNKIKT